MERTKLIQRIQQRLASCEDYREILRLKDEGENTLILVDQEMKELRLRLKAVMGSICPVVRIK